MVVEWPVANLDFDALRSNRGGKKDARRNNGNEQKFVLNHTPLIRARASRYMGLSRTAGRARGRFDRINAKQHAGLHEFYPGDGAAGTWK